MTAPSSCPHRGAPRQERLSLSYLARRTRQELFDLDHGLLATVWGLLCRPGVVTGSFIHGQMSCYYSPARYFVIVTTLSVLVGNAGAPLLDTFLVQMLTYRLFDQPDIARAWVADWNALLYAPLILCLALCTRYFFRSRALNLAEHLVIAMYGWSQLMLVSLLVFWVHRALLVAGLPAAVSSPLLLLPLAWWLYYCSDALRLSSLFDWIRAILLPPAAVLLYMMLMASMIGALVYTR